MGCATKVGVFAVVIGVAIFGLLPADVLKGISGSQKLSGTQLQLAIAGFCLSPIPAMLMKAERGRDTGGDFDFATDGDIENEDYDKESVYSLLYAMYANAGTVISDLGVPYEFTFNTWGIAPSPYGPEEPQRHGKAAYRGLVELPAAKAYLAKNGDTPKIVEIGCGTGAGANLISRELLPKADYTGIDMQFAAIDTCRRKHATEDNPGLKCVHSPGGVGNKGNQARDIDGEIIADNTVDFVIISETHIADIVIGPEEIKIFEEIRRILKPGGVFLWGNALPTRVWEEADVYFSSAESGFDLVDNLNHTAGAITARDEDEDRVNAYVDSMLGQYPLAFKMPFKGAECRHVVDRLIKSFYRHPGTALYLKMVSGYDSYMHQAYVKQP